MYPALLVVSLGRILDLTDKLDASQSTLGTAVHHKLIGIRVLVFFRYLVIPTFE